MTSDACQTVATFKSPISNACDAVGNLDACQTGAPIESTISNACDAVGNGDARQTGATKESKLSNAGDAVGDNRILTTGDECIGGCFDYRIAVFSAIIRGISTRNHNACQTGALIESIISNTCDAVGNNDGG